MNIKNENVIIKPKVTVGKKKSRGNFLKKFKRTSFLNKKNENIITNPKVIVGKTKSRGNFLKKFKRKRF